ncbi:MAG TPA: cellulase family glycosylhydrolase [Solirubrobacteraceae bacterium]|nr:cellulase family glycosylhydrolase [Solirubrobacteraceae bacterium]
MLALAVPALVGLPAGASADGPLEVRDGALRDERGREVVLRGVNVVVGRAPWIPAGGGSEARSFDSADAGRVRAMGLNAIRLGITWEGVMPAPDAVSEAYLDRVARTVRTARRAGLHVVVAMHQKRFSSRFGGHGAPAWAVRDGGRSFDGPLPFPFEGTEAPVGRAFTALWVDEDGLRGRYAQAWRAVAARLTGQARVVGYDLIEAPGCDVNAAPCGQPPGPQAAGRWLAPFYAALVPAVRAADDTHPVLYQDWATSAFGFPAQLGQAPNPPWALPGNVRAYGVACGTPLRSAPCRTQRAEAIRRARRAARDDGGTSLIARFGERGDVADDREVVELADRYGEGWFFGAYKGYGDAGARPLYSDRGRPFASRVRSIAVPYPQRIAGRDAQWAFDRADGHFTLRYRPRGSAETVVALPRGAFPVGLRLRVSGALARRDGGVVHLRARDGARTVRLTVTNR